MEHYRETDSKLHSVEQAPFSPVNNEKLKGPNDMANTFNNFLIQITEKLKAQY
jgi:hypothetical protein